MSSLSISVRRKRDHLSEFVDNSDSEELPHPKRQKHGGFIFPFLLDFSVAFKTKLQEMTEWFLELRKVNKFVRMALKCGATLPVSHHPEELENDVQVDDDDDDEDDDDILRDDDDDDDDIEIQEFKENVTQEKHFSSEFGKSHFSNDSECSKQHQAINGSYSLGSLYNSHKHNGANARELSTRYHGTTNCSLRREKTDKLKRQPLISNPATEIEILLGTDPEVVTVEDDDGIKVLSESPCSKPKIASSQKPFRSYAKSKNSVTALKQTHSTPIEKSYSSASKSYTAYDVVRLQEKAQYKLLLEKYIKGSPYQYACKKPEKDLEIKYDTGTFTTRHFKKEVLQQPIDSFIEKYYTPCHLLPPEVKKSSEKKKEPSEITIDDSEDDEVQCLEMKTPQYKPVFKSQLFTPAWLKELKKHVSVVTDERNKIVEDYEQKLEKYKKQRLLREFMVDMPVHKAVEPEFPELTPEMEDVVDNILNTGAPDDVICQPTTGALLRKDFETLIGLKWLNDNIINAYFGLIMTREKKEGYLSTYAFSTYFYSSFRTKGYASVQRWTRKLDIFSYDLNFVPLHLTCHWCLVVIDHRSKTISYYDSMGKGEETSLNVIRDYLCIEYKVRKGQCLDPNTYTTKTLLDIPQQMNGSDCGMFTLKYADYLSRNVEITFNQQHMAYFRRRAIYEIATSQLL